jgi:hypothetical protein
LLSRTGPVPLAINREHVGANWIAGDNAPGKVCSFESDSADLGETTSESIDSSSNGVLFGDNHGNPPDDRSHRCGHACVATDDEHDRRSTTANDCHSRNHCSQKSEDRSNIAE